MHDEPGSVFGAGTRILSVMNISSRNNEYAITAFFCY